MNQNHKRRDFIKMAAMSGISFSLAGKVIGSPVNSFKKDTLVKVGNDIDEPTSLAFRPNRIASWWCTLEDIIWPQKASADNIKKRAEGFAKAKIDTAIIYGFHARFDFSNYFGHLHGYFENVAHELHKYNIRFMDHYSCNNVERPRGDSEVNALNKGQRHHILLYPDPIAAKFAQYEGHFFQDICEVDLRDGSRGYATQYQFDTFCHNNPAFLDMHSKYLIRLLAEVPIDGIEIDDMCNYAGLATCGCKFCRSRFRKDYGHEIPPFGEKSFWGETANKNMLYWGNYENPVFRDWLKMKADSIVDHLKMARSILDNKPLMTCCSSAGPIVLNAITLDLERMAPYLDLFMLENVGINTTSVDWVEKEPEAILQKDIARANKNAPAMALSYTVYEKGGYLGWCLSRFWGVANWSSTLDHRLEVDPPDPMEIENIIGPYNNWEIINSDLHYNEGRDLVEVRLVSNGYCRQNGWKSKDGREQWDSVKTWSSSLVKYNIGYRILRAAELSDAIALSKENTPLILDNLGCVSDRQFSAIKYYLSRGGTAWLALPFGIKDEKGFMRSIPLSVELLKSRYKNLQLLEPSSSGDPMKKFLSDGRFKPVLTQLAGDHRWATRIRTYGEKTVIHFMNTALVAIPHPVIKDNAGIPVLNDINSAIADNMLEYNIDTTMIKFGGLSLMSPELDKTERKVAVNFVGKNIANIRVNLEGIKIYAVLQ
jgi:hypothetical protein